MLPAILEDAASVAIDAAKAGGEVLLHYYKMGIYKRRMKDDTSYQTTADLEAERVILHHIQRCFPDHSVYSEEAGQTFTSGSPYRWMIDPLDGTDNFVLGIPYFSSSITLFEQNQPVLAVVYNPVTDELYTAERGKGARLNGDLLRVSATTSLQQCKTFFIPDFHTKRLPATVVLRERLYERCRRVLDTWSPALDWCLIARGKADLLVAVTTHPLQPDMGTLFLEEAGGRITHFKGKEIGQRVPGYLVASNGTLLHTQVLEIIHEKGGDHDGDR